MDQQALVERARRGDHDAFAALVDPDHPAKKEPRVVGTRGSGMTSNWLRGKDSNLRPSGYEPDELPLLHPAKA